MNKLVSQAVYVRLNCMQDILTDMKMVTVPLTGLARVALPSKKERAALISTLEQDSEYIKNGQFTTFVQDAFFASMLVDYDRRLQAK